jgi:hypothetical protein
MQRVFNDTAMTCFSPYLCTISDSSFGKLIKKNKSRLEDAGHSVGERVIELVGIRDKGGKRENRLIAILQFTQHTIWKYLFNKSADELQVSTEEEGAYMLNEYEPLTNIYISIPSDLAQLNCAAFTAGIIRGVLHSADFPAKVTAHLQPVPGKRDKTTYLVKFNPEVIAREKRNAS